MTIDKKPSRSWIAKQLEPSAFAALKNGLPASDLWSALMDVASERAGRRTPSELRQQWDRDRFVAPSSVDQRVQIDIDNHLFAVAKDFEALEISPLAPLGSCSAIAPGTQNRIVSTMRGTEVVSDPTNVLALESARRLQTDPSKTVRLATSHRCVRAQPVPKGPGFAAHFRLFCLTTAGKEVPDHEFVVSALIEHIRFHLDAMARLSKNGYGLGKPMVRLLSTPNKAHLVERIAAAFPSMEIERQSLTQTYYHGLRFMVNAARPDGEVLFLSDGGAFDWLEQLLSNKRMAFVASGMGSQRVAAACAKREH